jgi:glycosyltransferase involved in cell wall biosynthesis
MAAGASVGRFMTADETISAVVGAASPDLVSVIVVAYRQEAYIRAAVRSVFAQTYPNLEIILSDDCSPDRTFEIMQEEAAAYRGPYKLILNRNATNLGVAGNYNRAAELAGGELLIVQDGDDISRPDRVAVVARAALEPTAVDMVCSQVVIIDGDGQGGEPWLRPPVEPLTLEGALDRGSISALGCAAAYSRSLWTIYGPIDSEVLQEDMVLPFRALLGRGIRVVDEPLVQYRVHDANLFAFKGALEGQKAVRPRPARRRWARSADAICRDWRRAWVAAGRDGAIFDDRLGRQLKARAYDAELYDRSRGYALGKALWGLVDGLTLRNVAGLVRRHVVRAGR